MRAFAFAGALLLVVVAISAVLPAPVLAAATCTGMGVGCPAGQDCLRDGVGGVCVPAACLSLGAACFEGSGMAADRYAAGDCDGDLRSNGSEELAGTDPCELPLVLTFPFGGAPGGPVFSAVPGRLDDPGGAQIAPDAYTFAPDAFAVACRRAADCPVFRDEPARCVLLPVPTSPADLGACTYHYALEDDASCLEVAPDANGCFDFVNYTIRYDQWEHGDCDGDGIANKQDGPVCRANLVALAGPDGTPFQCSSGFFDSTLCMVAGLESHQLTDDLVGCSTMPEGGLEVGACCARAADCPGDRDSFARCVFFLESGGQPQGVCLYDGTPLADDRSCLAASPPGIRSACFASTPSYPTLMEGDCDSVCSSDVNRVDPAVCACAEPDAGVGLDAAMPWAVDSGAPVDAAIPAATDAGPLDAAGSAVDAGREDAGPGAEDAAGLDAGPISFVGGGCRCAVGAPRGTRVSWLVATAAVGAALARLGRRRRA
jgi:hypothetical protein